MLSPVNLKNTLLSMPSKLPKLYGHYRLISLINSGGMGDIFLAKDTQLQRSVAIKLLRPNNPDNHSTRSSLENSIEEGRILAKLSHPNIVQVFDVVDSEDNAGFVMEYIDGQNLQDLPKHKLTFDDKLAMLTQIADGLAAAHKQDIIHCDIKPANIIIGENNQVKIADFGIARLQSKMQSPSDKAPQYGSPAYMAPELWHDNQPNKLSDWFSFGVLAFELLAGFHPYSSNPASHQQIGENIQHKSPEPAQNIRPILPTALIELLNQLIRKSPANRLEDSNDIANRMNYIAQSYRVEKQQVLTTQTIPIPQLKRRKRPYIVLTVLALLIFTSFFVFQKSKNAPYYVTVLKPVIQNKNQPLSGNQSMLLAAIDDTLRRSVIQQADLKLIAHQEADHASKDLSLIGLQSNADAIIQTVVNCSDTSCDIDFSLVTPSLKDGEPVWEVAKRNKWMSLLENYSDIAQVSQAQIQQLLSEHVQEFKKIRPLNERAYHQYLAIYQSVMFNGAYNEALLEQSEVLIQQNPSFLAGYHLVMDICEKLFVEQNDNRLLKRLETNLAYMPKESRENPHFLKYLFYFYLNTEQRPKAKSLLNELFKLPLPMKDYKPLEAAYLLASNQYQAAIAAYQEAIQLRPYKALYYNLALAYWWNNDIKSANVFLNKALLLSPKDYEVNQLLATAHLLQGNTSGAIEVYKVLMSLNPSSMEMSNLALAYLLQGDYEQSYLYAKQAVDKSPQNPMWILNLADIQTLRDNHQEAKHLYQQVIQKYAGQTQLSALLGLAQAYAHRQNYSEAIKVLDEARKLSPGNAEVAYISSLVLTLADEHLSAINQASEALNNGIGPIWFKLSWFDKLCAYDNFKKLFNERENTRRC